MTCWSICSIFDKISALYSIVRIENVTSRVRLKISRIRLTACNFSNIKIDLWIEFFFSVAWHLFVGVVWKNTSTFSRLSTPRPQYFLLHSPNFCNFTADLIIDRFCLFEHIVWKEWLDWFYLFQKRIIGVVLVVMRYVPWSTHRIFNSTDLAQGSTRLKLRIHNDLLWMSGLIQGRVCIILLMNYAARRSSWTPIICFRVLILILSAYFEVLVPENLLDARLRRLSMVWFSGFGTFLLFISIFALHTTSTNCSKSSSSITPLVCG